MKYIPVTYEGRDYDCHLDTDTYILYIKGAGSWQLTRTSSLNRQIRDILRKVN